jgi:hypothetical protein
MRPAGVIQISERDGAFVTPRLLSATRSFNELLFNMMPILVKNGKLMKRITIIVSSPSTYSFTAVGNA